VTIIFAVTLVPSVGAQTASFSSLGQMPGAMRGAGTFANGISGDGSTIVGDAWVCPGGGTTCSSSGKTEAFLWTVAGKYKLLGDLEGSFGNSPSATGSMAFASSSNGSVVVGEAPQGSNTFGAFRWTAAHGMMPLPTTMLFANAVTPDGSMTVGGDVWVTSSGQSGIFGPFPGEQDQTQALGVVGTAAAPVAVGAAIKGSGPFGATFHAFRWTPVGGLQDLGLTTGNESIADAISADGLTIVGQARDASGFWRAFRWTSSTGMVDIGTLGGPESASLAVSRDGTVIVGTSLTSGSTASNRFFRWTAKTGMQDILVALQAAGVHTADKWITLASAGGISANGTVITGFGQSPATKAFPFGVNTPFRIVLPVP
jgi:probable HAF family extracellular repeat protein